jgi:uncharacterized OsmC-like protein
MSAPDGRVDLTQVEKYRFTIEFAQAPFPGLTLDEPPPAGGDAGPNPTQSLAMAVGHCMSSTLVNTLSRARIAVTPLTTTVTATIGPNAQGRRRVRELHVEIRTRPLNEADREQFDRCVEIFADYCTVSGAVREGVAIDHKVTPG